MVWRRWRGMQAMLVLEAATMRRLQPSAWTLGEQCHEMETSLTKAGGSRKHMEASFKNVIINVYQVHIKY